MGLKGVLGVNYACYGRKRFLQRKAGNENGHLFVSEMPPIERIPDPVAENLALGLERGGLWRRVNWRERNARARELLGRIGARIDPQTPAGALTMPEQQLVEIARALGSSPESGAKILIMDEPTASLTDRETERLFKVIAELREQGVGVIYISHRLEELFKIADRVTVLRDGETVATRAMDEVDQAEMIRLMVGRELSAVFPKR